MLLNCDGGTPFTEAHHAATYHQLQCAFVIELGRPTDAHLQAQTRRQGMRGRKQHAPARYVDRLAFPGCFRGPLVQDAIAHVPFNRKSLRPAALYARMPPV